MQDRLMAMNATLTASGSYKKMRPLFKGERIYLKSGCDEIQSVYCSVSQRSASIADWQPRPAAVIACR